jgi:hypothetical protein
MTLEEAILASEMADLRVAICEARLNLINCYRQQVLDELNQAKEKLLKLINS